MNERTMENRTVQNVIQAIKREGPHPEFHRKIMAKHREEWPTLWIALDELVRVWRNE